MRCTFTVRLSKRPARLHDIEFFHAASTPKLSFSAGFARAIGFVVIAGIFVILAAMFSAALTPVQSQRVVVRPIRVPTLHTNNATETQPIPTWPVRGELENPSYFQGDPTTVIPGTSEYTAQWMSRQGVFTYDPSAKRAALIDAASDTSWNSIHQRVHAKLDNTGYFYDNRSYGAGTAAGFAEPMITHEPMWYEHLETGFQTHISCQFNESMAFELAPIKGINGVVGNSPSRDIAFAAYSTYGTHPDPERTPIPAAAYFSNHLYGILAWTTVYPNHTDSKEKAIYLSVRALANRSDDNWGFRYFDKLQCRISFEAKPFHVLVNETSKIISVTPRGDSESSWPCYGDTVASEISWWLWAISAFEGCLNGSMLGRALRLNQEQLRLLTTGDSLHTSTIKATEDFLADVVDNTLNLLASTRYVSAGHLTSVRAQITIPAVVLGSKAYAIAVFALSIVALLIHLGVAVWTALCRDMVDLNPTNMTRMLSSALVGGSHSAPEAISRLKRNDLSSELLIMVCEADQGGDLPFLKAMTREPDDKG